MRDLAEINNNQMTLEPRLQEYIKLKAYMHENNIRTSDAPFNITPEKRYKITKKDIETINNYKQAHKMSVWKAPQQTNFVIPEVKKFDNNENGDWLNKIKKRQEETEKAINKINDLSGLKCQYDMGFTQYDNNYSKKKHLVDNNDTSRLFDSKVMSNRPTSQLDIEDFLRRGSDSKIPQRSGYKNMAQHNFNYVNPDIVVPKYENFNLPQSSRSDNRSDIYIK